MESTGHLLVCLTARRVARFSNWFMIASCMRIHRWSVYESARYTHSQIVSKSHRLFGSRHRHGTVSGMSDDADLDTDAPDTGQFVEPNLDTLCRHLNIEGASEARRRLHLTVLERTNLRLANSVAVPRHVNTWQWAALMNIDSTQGRARYFACLADKERKRAAHNARVARDLNESEVRNREKVLRETGVNYGVAGRNTFVCNSHRRIVNLAACVRVCRAMVFGPRVAIDLSCEHQMTRAEVDDAAHQLAEAHKLNTSASHPFDMHLCNVSPSSQCIRTLAQLDVHVFDRSCRTHAHHHSYARLFERGRLVYLSRHAPRVLERFCQHDVYVVGLREDRNPQLSGALEGARRSGVVTASFPVHKYVSLDAGSSTTLSLAATIRVLLSLNAGAGWRRVLSDNMVNVLSHERHRRQQVARAIHNQSLRLSAERRWRQSITSRPLPLY